MTADWSGALNAQREYMKFLKYVLTISKATPHKRCAMQSKMM